MERYGDGGVALALRSYGFEALAVEIDEMLGIVLCSRDGATLEACAGGSGAAKAGSGGDELHHLKCDFFIATQGRSQQELDWQEYRSREFSGDELITPRQPNEKAARCR